MIELTKEGKKELLLVTGGVMLDFVNSDTGERSSLEFEERAYKSRYLYDCGDNVLDHSFSQHFRVRKVDIPYQWYSLSRWYVSTPNMFDSGVVFSEDESCFSKNPVHCIAGANNSIMCI